jgi:hypothetical protein
MELVKVQLVNLNVGDAKVLVLSSLIIMTMKARTHWAVVIISCVFWYIVYLIIKAII